LPEQRTTAQEILLRELKHEKGDEATMRQNRETIDGWLRVQDFRERIESSGWLGGKSSGNVKMTDEEYKEYMVMKNRKNKEEGIDEINRLECLEEEMKPTLSSK
jgi:hypothetical protein